MLPQPTGLRGRALLLAYRAGVEAAIDALDREGLVEPTRLGVIGFSAMGNVAQDLITFSRHRFAAATIADAWTFSLFGYATYGAMDEAESFMESRPWGADIATWVERDPSLHTDNITAALRLEQYSPYVLPQWDIYALLRRQQKPVELVMLPYGAYQLRRPRERFVSLEGNVDWFDFWLNGHEDPDPAKAGQYARWRRLREQRDTNARSPTAPSPARSPR
jgi:dipeptidyl aminopeptidase/acylaminoacyl peptidase